MTTQDASAVDLADLLDCHRQEIAVAWAALTQPMADAHHREHSLAVISSWTAHALRAMADMLHTGSYAAIEDHLTEIAITRLDVGLTVQEIIEGLLLGKQAVLPFLWQSFPPESAEARAALAHLDHCLSYMVGRFGFLYAEAMHGRLLREKQRSETIRSALELASSSLDLDDVLRRIADRMAAATGMSDCGIYLFGGEPRGWLPRLYLSWLDDAGRAVLLRQYLDLSTSSLLKQAVETKRPVRSLDPLADPRANRERAEALGAQSVLVIPITWNDTVIAAAAVFSFNKPHVFSDDDVDVTSGIAKTVALAVRNAQLYEETQRRLAESHGIARVSAALLEKNGLQETLAVVCAEARQLVGATGSSVLLLENDSWLRVVHSSGEAQPVRDRLPLDSAWVQRLLREGKPILVNEKSSELYAYLRDPNLTALLAVPLRVDSVVIGVLAVVNKPGGFAEEDVRIISLFADSTAIAIEHARLQQQAEQAAVTEERQRLARELHDSVTQSLYSVTLYAEAAAMALGAGKHEVATDHLRELRETAQDAMRDMRLLIFELHPPILEKVGLAAALRNRLSAVEARAGLETSLRVDGEGRLPLWVEKDIYWIAQEALNNVVKHARARSVTVHLNLSMENAYLHVEDDGVGFDLATIETQGGVGMRSMRERAARVGGRTRVTSSPGHGTLIEVEMANPGELAAAR
jgi:signal transduction histidine kinase